MEEKETGDLEVDSKEGFAHSPCWKRKDATPSYAGAPCMHSSTYSASGE